MKTKPLIERKQYMQALRNQKEMDIIKVVTGVRRCGKSTAYLLSGELATLLTGRYIETSILPLQFVELYENSLLKSPNLPKLESLGNYIVEGGIPEYYYQQEVSQKQADDSESDI